MTNYIKINSDSSIVYPYSLEQLRQDNKNVSFVKEPNDETLAEYNVYRVDVAPIPEHDSATQTAQENLPVLRADGVYQVLWTVIDMGEEELLAAQEEVEEQVRAEKNRLLRESDWTQLPDTDADKEAWAQYRVLLRTINIQEGFPDNVVWPTKPE